jgi:hypothetical protein
MSLCVAIWHWTLESVLPTKNKHVSKKIWAEFTSLWNPESQRRLPAHWILLRFQAHKLSVHIIIYIKKNIRIIRRWIDHILRINCLLKHVIEGKPEVMGRRGRKRKQLLNNLKEIRRCWKFKEAAPDCTVWANFVIGCGPLMRGRYYVTLMFKPAVWLRRLHYGLAIRTW